MSKKNNSEICLYLTELTSHALLDNNKIKNGNYLISVDALKVDWQHEFCNQLGYSKKSLPWNKLRALQFDIDSEFKTLACCDPVLMQMTHRGAYLWGQDQLSFSKEDVIRIIAQINQQLMSDDECFYLLNNNQWLYTNKKHIKLNQESFEKYIGKDMFGFSYQGLDGLYWNKLATEIQMLLKQMMDYQGLTQVPPENIVNVHFWGDTSDNLTYPFEKIEDANQCVFSSDYLIESFFKEAGITNYKLEKFSEIFHEKSNKSTLDKIILIDKTQNNDISIISQVLQELDQEKVDMVKIITQDKVIKISVKQTFWQKIFKYFN